MANRIYTFKSGYPVTVRATYSAGLLNVHMAGWKELNPIPNKEDFMDVQEVKAKGGTREIKTLRQAEYQTAMMLWQVLFENEKATRRIELAIDPEPIDKDLLAKARAALAEQGLESEKNDVLFYLSLVAHNGRGEPGDADYEVSEMTLLNRFIDEEKGPPSALIEHLMRTTFRNADLPQAQA